MAFMKFFLANAPLNLLPHLGQFQLGTENLVFFLLQSTLSLLQGSLQFHLFSLQTLPNLVNLVNRSSTLTNLVHDILDFIAQGLIL